MRCLNIGDSFSHYSIKAHRQPQSVNTKKDMANCPKIAFQLLENQETLKKLHISSVTNTALATVRNAPFTAHP